MRYVIVGAGAIGTSLAAQFESAGVDYLLLGRGAQLAHLREHGLRYRRPDGTVTVALKLTDEVGLRLRPGDVILLSVKTQDVEDSSRALAGLPVEGGGIGADLPIFALQNGLAAESILARRFDRVYSASVRVPAIYTETGKLSVLARPQFAAFIVGRYPEGVDAVSARLAADLVRANALVLESGAIQRWKAQKLLHNVKNSLELFAGDDALRDRIGADVSDEAERVLRAAGHEFPGPEDETIDLTNWEILRDPDDPAGQSTWQSFTRGAGSEVDFLNGEIVLLGHRHAAPTPWNRAACRLARQLAAQGGKPGDLGLDRLVSLAQDEVGLPVAQTAAAAPQRRTSRHS